MSSSGIPFSLAVAGGTDVDKLSSMYFFDSVYTACNLSRVTILSFISFMQLYSFMQSESQISLDADLALHRISFIYYICVYFSVYL